jgi:hypothetical protein
MKNTRRNHARPVARLKELNRCWLAIVAPKNPGAVRIAFDGWPLRNRSPVASCGDCGRTSQNAFGVLDTPLLIVLQVRFPLMAGLMTRTKAFCFVLKQSRLKTS